MHVEQADLSEPESYLGQNVVCSLQISCTSFGGGMGGGGVK